MDEGETIVYCQRCGRPGGKVAYGWAILCKQCRGDDDSEWFDQNKGKQWKIKTVLTAEAREHKATSTSSGAITPNAVGTGSTVGVRGHSPDCRRSKTKSTKRLLGRIMSI